MEGAAMIATCPTCGAKYQIQADLAQRKGLQCPRCQRPLPKGQAASDAPPDPGDLSFGPKETVVSGSAPPHLEGMSVTVAVVEGADKGARFALRKARVTLGRGDADIRLRDPEVSKVHAAITLGDEACALEDLQSTNGTYLNGKRVTRGSLSHLDEIRMGRTKLFFTILPAAQQEVQGKREGTRMQDRKRVLLVEGSPLRQALADLLAKANLKVIAAGEAREAKGHFERLGGELDLLVLDLELPKADGFDFLEWLRKPGTEGRPPILALARVCALPELLRSLRGLEVAALQPKDRPADHIAACAADLLRPGWCAPRVPLAPARIDAVCEIMGETFRGIIASLNRTGMTIQTQRTCYVGSEIRVNFVLPEVPRLLQAKGRVRTFQEGKGSVYLDLEFLGLDAEARSQIAAFVLATLSRSAPAPQADGATAPREGAHAGSI